MSFDIDLDKWPCEHCGRGGETVFSVNLTHNVNRIVDACLLANKQPPAARINHSPSYDHWSWGRLYGWSAIDAVPVLATAIYAANDPEREAEFRAMEPDNGWGSLESVRRVLGQLMSACQEHPECVIKVCG